MPQGPTERQWEALPLTLPSGFLVGQEEGGLIKSETPSFESHLCLGRVKTPLCLVSKMGTVTSPSLYVCED